MNAINLQHTPSSIQSKLLEFIYLFGTLYLVRYIFVPTYVANHFQICKETQSQTLTIVLHRGTNARDSAHRQIRTEHRGPLSGPSYLENHVLTAARAGQATEERSLCNSGGHRKASRATCFLRFVVWRGKKSRAVTHYPRDSVLYPCGKKKNANDEKRRRDGQRRRGKGSERLTSRPHERERGIK